MKKSQPETLASASRFPHLKNDVLASIVVFLVALPLCIGIAVAVGVSPTRALITGIVGGIVVGYFAGAPLQVSGPAAGLFVIIAELLATSRSSFLELHDVASMTPEAAANIESQAGEHALRVLGCAGMLAGAFQVVAGKLGLGPWFRAVSPAVIKGMLAGIGALILASQFHVMLDHRPLWDDKPAQGGLQHLAAIPGAIAKAFAGDDVHHLAAAIGVLTIVMLIAWPKFAPRRLRFLPAPLVAIVTATIVAQVTDFPIALLIVPSQFLSEVTLPNQESLKLFVESSVWVAAAVIAIVASAETLLCATAIDQMQSETRTNYDQELTGQGIGNLICGVLGALPMTGVIVRSATNVQAGAKTRLSTILHGAWLLVFVVVFPAVLAYIPKAALGAMLVYTGWKLLHIKEAKHLWQFSKTEAAIFLVTMVVIVVEDLLIGVLVGVGLSTIKLLYTFTHLRSDLVVNPDGRTAQLQLRGSATFVRLPKLAAELERVPAGIELHVDMYDLDYVDHACLDLLMNWAKQHEAGGGTLVMDWDRLHAKFKRELPVAASNGNGNGHFLQPAGAIAADGSDGKSKQHVGRRDRQLADR